MNWIQQFKKFKQFVGPQVFNLLILSVSTGLLWFFIESAFVFILQGFIYSLGITTSDKLILPSWYPTSTLATIIILLLFGLVRATASFLATYLSQRGEQAFLRNQRNRLLNFMFNNYQEISPSEGVSLFTQITSNSGSFVYHSSQLAIQITTAICLFGMGFYLAPKEMVVGFLTLAFFLFPIKYLSKKISIHGINIVKELENTNKTILFGFKNYFFIRLHGLIDREIERGAKSLKASEGHYKKYLALLAFNGSFPQFMGIAVICLLTFFGQLVFKTPGMVLLSFFYIFVRLTQTISASSGTFSFLTAHYPGFKKLYDWNKDQKIFKKDSPVTSPVESDFLKDLNNKGMEIIVRDLNFSYGPKPIIKNISFNLKEGNPLLVKGESGAGKSTLLSLLTGIIQPNSGEILFNNYPISEVKSYLPNILGYVGPDPYIFEGTIKENLMYGNDTIVSDKEIWETLDLVQLSKSLDNLDQKLHEYTELSTGQKQRLAIVRALLRKPKILILDEATANLDKDTEEKIIESLNSFKDSTSIIIISHKDTFDTFALNKLEIFPQNVN